MDLIVLRDISFRYDGTPVLVDIDLTIREGDFLAIIGPNGSGKTTLVKVALGLLEPSSGSVEAFGKPLGEFSDWQKIGYVPQKATHIDPFFPASVEEVVGMALLSNRKPGPGRGGKAAARSSGPSMRSAWPITGNRQSDGSPAGNSSACSSPGRS